MGSRDNSDITELVTLEIGQLLSERRTLASFTISSVADSTDWKRGAERAARGETFSFSKGMQSPKALFVYRCFAMI